MASNVFYIKQGDLLPNLSGQFVKSDGTPQSLLGATLEFHMKDPTTGEIVVNAAADIVDAETGRWKYEWFPGDTGPFDPPERREFEGEIQAMYIDKPLTAPNKKNFKIVMAPQIA